MKNPKIYLKKTLNEEYIRIWTHIIRWKFENNNALHDGMVHDIVCLLHIFFCYGICWMMINFVKDNCGVVVGMILKMYIKLLFMNKLIKCWLYPLSLGEKRLTQQHENAHPFVITILDVDLVLKKPWTMPSLLQF